jgi:hypothetical protein
VARRDGFPNGNGHIQRISNWSPNLGGNGRPEKVPPTSVGLEVERQIATVSVDPSFPYVTLTVLALLAAGSVLLLRSGSFWGKTLGIGLLATAPLISGTKFVLVEKFSPEIKIAWPESKSRPPADERPTAEKLPPQFSFTLTLPPFPQGSNTPDSNLRCVLHTLARDLATDLELSSVVVVGRADKRELKPGSRRKYATNWGLAQQRSACVQQVLVRTGIASSKVLATTAGPLHTHESASAELLAKDRSATLFVSGNGGQHKWSEGLTQGVDLTKCDDGAVLADVLCM